MVNRLWCRTVVPILWKNPWSYGGINYSKKNCLFTIISSYFSDDTKELLMKEGSLVPQKLPLFDYLSFCRSIDVITIGNIILIGYCSANNQSNLQAGSLEREFYDLFTRKCSVLKYLDMRLIDQVTTYYFPQDAFHFGSLYELKCDTYDDPSYFNEIARTSQYIQRLTVAGSKSNLGIVKLIEAQKNLKYFEWRESSQMCHRKAYSYNEILLALKKSANTINHLKLYFRYVGHMSVWLCPKLQLLPKLPKLKSLIINDFRYFDENQLKTCVFHDLEIFKACYYNLKACSILIQNNGKGLKKIFLGTNKRFFMRNFDLELDEYNFNFHFSDDSLIFIRKVYENCPLIKYLSLIFTPSKDHFNELENLLKICQHLKILLIKNIYINEVKTEKKILENGKNLLKALINSAPTNLREIRICYNCKFSLETLEEFFKNWKGASLSIITSSPIYKEEHYMNLINKYKNIGVIRDFRHDPFLKQENEFEI
ncbi:hypothetical protein RclHR1_06980003 [Rhizophagus clarus]|nr:hypothetical protein RclHR1_06980003 [Rhizophagus clarus]